MCKTYDAIYELAKHMDTNTLICSVGNIIYEGELHKCNCMTNDCKCFEGVVTLKNVTATCMIEEKTKNMNWVNISSKHIQAFTFKA